MDQETIDKIANTDLFQNTGFTVPTTQKLLVAHDDLGVHPGH